MEELRTQGPTSEARACAIVLRVATIDQVRAYWDAHIHDLEITKHPVGSRGFFDDLDQYHFEKLHHLLRLVDFDGYRGRKRHANTAQLGRGRCERRAGVGADGLILCGSVEDGASMRPFNANGSRAEVSGHGGRALAPNPEPRIAGGSQQIVRTVDSAVVQILAGSSGR